MIRTVPGYQFTVDGKTTVHSYQLTVDGFRKWGRERSSIPDFQRCLNIAKLPKANLRTKVQETLIK